MSPVEYLQLCTAAVRSPVASKALQSTLAPFRFINCEDVWERTVKGTGAHQLIKVKADFGPDKTVRLEILIPVSGVARTTMTCHPKDGEPTTETFNFDPANETDLSGWVSVVLSAISEHCPPKHRDGGYFLG